MATQGSQADHRGPGYVYLLREATPRGITQYYRVGHGADLVERMSKLPTRNPGGVDVVASFLVDNMLAAEQAAKSALSSVPELRINDFGLGLGGDKGWYFSTGGKPTIQDITTRVLQAVGQYLLTEARVPATSQKVHENENNSVYLVSTELSGTYCFGVVLSYGDSTILEIRENNPSKVRSVELGSNEKDKTSKRLQEITQKVFSYLNDPEIKHMASGWYSTTDPAKLTIEKIAEIYSNSWCSIM